MPKLDDFHVLIIVSNAKLRALLRNLLATFGFGVIHFAVSAHTALRHLRARHYELILCDYALGEGQDGQHLLEDLRQHEIIASDTLFVMITGERNYERVIGAAELLPDDYILTPLSPGALYARLNKILEKRQAFLPAWQLAALGDWLGAIEYCLGAETKYPQYLVDFNRLEAGFYIAAGQLDEAEAVYRQIVATQRIPWAQLGLARCLAFKKDYAGADALLSELIAENSNFMAAYDLLARVRAESGKSQDACEVLRTAIERSPYRLGRQRRMGELALEAGDAVAAEKALAEVVRQSAHSGFRDPEVHVRLAQAQIVQGKTAAARATIADIERSMGSQPNAALCKSLASAMLHAFTGDAEQAQADLDAAATLTSNGATLSPALSRELVKACFDQNLADAGSEVVTNILRSTGDEPTVLALREMLKQRGLELLSRKIEQRVEEEVRALIKIGAERARSGDYDGSVEAMMDAVRQMPGHTVVLFNAALAVLRHIEHRGWSSPLARQARTLIERARLLDPSSGRLSTLAEYMHVLIERNGVVADRDTAPAYRRARG
ncbi:MAG: tetratricopeptide repeat protein [Azoarcus sp.]|jgi:DNA-binding response OmpR family regulator/lipopolysaccharide biosynthesis regulator YciM|nr:tetratricopeptide repeat protein [Azoarcus sp.]